MSITRRSVIAAGLGVLPSALVVAAVAHSEPHRNNVIEVNAKSGATDGALRFQGQEYHCMVGRSGILHPKYEGDGGTPAGTFLLREVRYRPDRVPPPKSSLPVFKASPTDGWCDDPEDPAYNRIVHMPYQTDAEIMWRDDSAYDVLAVIGYNDAPPIPGAGSAIFLHVMRSDVANVPLPTAGCISMKMDDLLTVLAGCEPGTIIDIRQT